MRLSGLIVIAFVLGVNATAAEGWTPDRDQRAWLAKHPVIQVDVDRELHPFSFSDDSGIARGVMVDLCTELSKRLGITLQVTPRHYPEIAERMDAGVVEVAAGMNLQDLRDPDSYRKTRTVISVPWGAFGRSDEPPIDRLQDLAGRTVVVYAGIDTTTRHFDGLEGCTFVEAPTVLDAVAMVLDGRADAYYDVYVTVDYHLQRALIAGLKPLLVSESRVDSGFVVRRDLAPLIPILHHALDDLSLIHI